MNPNKTIKKLGDHKTACVIAIIVLVLFVAFSVVRFNAIHGGDGADSGDNQSQESTVTDEQNEALSKLTEEQRDKQASYDQDTKDFIAILKANVWASEDQIDFVSFADTTFTQRTKNGDSTTTAFVVNALKTEDGGTEDDAQVTTLTAAIELADGEHIFTLKKLNAQNGSVQYLATSDMLSQPSSMYGPVAASSDVTVDGLNQEVIQLCGNDRDKLVGSIKSYVSQYMPTYDKFVWTQNASIDWRRNVVTITFSEDGEENSRELIGVDYDRNKKTLECYALQ